MLWNVARNMVKIMGKRTELIKYIQQLDDDKVDKLYEIAMPSSKTTIDEPQDLSEFLGILNWNIDAVAYQREIRDEWD